MQWRPPADIDLTMPRTVDELGIPEALVHDIVLRQAVAMGRTSTLKLSTKLALGPGLMTRVVEDLRDLQFLEVQGMDGRDYLLAPTAGGRQQAKDRMELSRYVGPVPVGLATYSAVIRAQHASPKIDLAALREAFSDLVIDDDLLRELGPAAIAGGAMFLYGPPGTGKSSIAERLLRIHRDLVLVPYAVEVDSQIINVFDPMVHKPVEDQPSGIDRRWVLCERPCVIVGGELSPDMLDLAHQSGTGTYSAPIQMQANNGVLVIDDFGRQAHLTPEALLNRWIVPLDRQRDHLTLAHGVKFDIPFDVKIVFSTNLQPETLGDEAFFRRIQSKVLIPSITDEAFDEVLRRVCAAKGVALTPDAPAHLRRTSRELGDGDLRPYLPAAVCRILASICSFEDLPLELHPAMIDRIAHLYFTHTDDRGHEVPVAAGPRRQVTMPRATSTSPTPTPGPHHAAPPVTTPTPSAAPAPAPVPVLTSATADMAVTARPAPVSAPAAPTPASAPTHAPSPAPAPVPAPATASAARATVEPATPGPEAGRTLSGSLWDRRKPVAD